MLSLLLIDATLVLAIAVGAGMFLRFNEIASLPARQHCSRAFSLAPAWIALLAISRRLRARAHRARAPSSSRPSSRPASGWPPSTAFLSYLTSPRFRGAFS